MTHIPMDQSRNPTQNYDRRGELDLPGPSNQTARLADNISQMAKNCDFKDSPIVREIRVGQIVPILVALQHKIDPSITLESPTTSVEAVAKIDQLLGQLAARSEDWSGSIDALDLHTTVERLLIMRLDGELPYKDLTEISRQLENVDIDAKQLNRIMSLSCYDFRPADEGGGFAKYPNNKFPILNPELVMLGMVVPYTKEELIRALQQEFELRAGEASKA